LGKWPALDVLGGDDLALAAVDEFAPTAAEDRQGALRLYFATPVSRDAAAASLSHLYSVLPVEIDDGDWARRSQERLEPIAIGRVLVLPDTGVLRSNPSPPIERRSPVSMVIRPSMGFGTGHHATTRLCLLALQAADLSGAFVLDVGTGSGILAIAAARLGAGCALGLDSDPDAIQAANENLRLNVDAQNVRFEVSDLLTATLPQADLIVANLTGTLLTRTAATLLGALSPFGSLIVSGILADEEEMVVRAFSDAIITQRQEDGEWRCWTLARPR